MRNMCVRHRSALLASAGASLMGSTVRPSSCFGRPKNPLQSSSTLSALTVSISNLRPGSLLISGRKIEQVSADQIVPAAQRHSSSNPNVVRISPTARVASGRCARWRSTPTRTGSSSIVISR